MISKAGAPLKGQTVPPSSERGRGLPSAPINALLTARDGRLYAGTNCGLAWSDDDGESWQWVRGRNWEQKSRQLFRDKANSASPPPLQVLAAGQKAPAQSGAGSFEVLREDYVSCLAQDGAGRLLIGHWRAGWEMREPTGARALAFGDAPDYVRAFLSTSEGLLIASYGSGLLRADLPATLNSPAAATYSGPPLKMLPSGILFDLPKFPAPVRPPTAQQLKEVTREVVSLREPSPPGHAAYLGEDWETRGDWMGRYGRQHAVLCAAQSPTDHEIAWKANYPIEGMNGSHQNAGDGLRRWVDRERWDDERVLYDPFLGYRREAEWDDHGEAYVPEWEGPDAWFRLQVPRGTHRLSLYFFNKDGDAGLNRWRDYLIEVKGKAADVQAAHFAPTLARCRVRDFRMGVYERFVLQGPSEFWVRVGKNSSFNTTLNGIFLDRIDDPQRSHEWGELPMTGNIGHSPPADVPPRELPAEPQLELYKASRDLWRALDTATVARDSAAHQENARVLAYRAFSTAGASMSQLARWRWAIPLWLGDDRGFHLQRMEETFKAQQKLQNPANNVP